VVTGKKEDKKCVGSGTIVNKNGKSYICDPPVGFESSKSDDKFSFLNLFFFNPFSLFS